jgi:hypothetical protein
MNVTPISAITMVQSLAQGDTLPLGERLSQAMAEAYIKAGADRHSLVSRANDGYTASNPETLAKLQTDLSSYSIRMATTAGLLAHATKGLDTILKS